MSAEGVLILSRFELDNTPDGQPRLLRFLRIGSLDRIVPHTGGLITSPRVTTDRNGKLLFTTYDSIAIIDPLQIKQNSFVPRIVLEAVLVNRRTVPPTPGSRFVEPEDIQFEYTSLPLRNPENVRFRYAIASRLIAERIRLRMQRKATSVCHS